MSKFNEKRIYPERTLSLSIYEPKDIGNCSNNGLSSKFDRCFVRSEREKDDEFYSPEVYLFERYIPYDNSKIIYAYPAELCDAHKWGLFGGCYVDTSDASFREISQNPIRLMDRIEEKTNYGN